MRDWAPSDVICASMALSSLRVAVSCASFSVSPVRCARRRSEVPCFSSARRARSSAIWRA
jgi:hypothetical protein